LIRLCLRHAGLDGQRISKTVGDPLNGGYKEYYLRDAQGNVMAMYKYAENGASLKVTERPVYGSSRLGSYTRQMELVGEPTIINYPYTQPMQAPLKRYELTDHLGNVNTVVTGRLPLLGPGVQYQAEVVSAQTLEPYGSLLPNRNWNSAIYKWGFNTQLKDDEVYGSAGTSYDFGERIYDPRVGRWFSIDPGPSSSRMSPYAFVENSPVTLVDPGGLDGTYYINGKTITFTAKIIISGSGATEAQAIKMTQNIMSKWGKGGNYTDENGNEYNVKFKVSVEILSANNYYKDLFNSSVNRVTLLDPGDKQLLDGDRSSVRGGNKGFWNNTDGAAVQAHEVGHFLGLADGYTEWRLAAGNLLGQPAHPGPWTSSNNSNVKDKLDIMGTAAVDNPSHARVSQQSINALAKYALDNAVNGGGVIRGTAKLNGPTIDDTRLYDDGYREIRSHNIGKSPSKSGVKTTYMKF
jgi:RHS repeat-associated protein